MAQQVLTVTATGNSNTLVLNHHQTPFNASFFLEVPAGVTVACKMQFTGSKLEDNPTWPIVWLDDATITTGTSANKVTSYSYPITAVRLVVATLTGGSGTVRLVANQGRL